MQLIRSNACKYLHLAQVIFTVIKEIEGLPGICNNLDLIEHSGSMIECRRFKLQSVLCSFKLACQIAAYCARSESWPQDSSAVALAVAN